MATESVIAPHKLEALDKINRLTRNAEGVLAMMMAAEIDDLPGDAVHDASEAVREMVREVRELATQAIAP